MAGSIEKVKTEYVIMHRETPVASVCTDGTCAIYARQFMPYNLYLDEDDDSIDGRVNNLANFHYWCSGRVLSVDRKYLKEILNSLSISQATTDRDRSEIAISYHGLSLTDVHWLKSADEVVKYADINLYEHSLSDAFVDVCLRGKQLTAQNSEMLDDADVAGDIGTQGVTPKAWIRRDGEFYLLKDGDPRDVDAELLASRIIDCFNIDHISYVEHIYDGSKVTMSRLMTSIDIGIVPAEYIEVYAANHDTTLMDIATRIDNYGFHMMNIVDYLTGNTDRHYGNWGFIVDNSTNELIKLHPLMDYNKAFNSYDDIDGARCLTVSGTISQREAAVEGVRQVGLNQVAEIEDDWFDDIKALEMFRVRMRELEKQCRR